MPKRVILIHSVQGMTASFFIVFSAKKTTKEYLVLFPQPIQPGQLIQKFTQGRGNLEVPDITLSYRIQQGPSYKDAYKLCSPTLNHPRRPAEQR